MLIHVNLKWYHVTTKERRRSQFLWDVFRREIGVVYQPARNSISTDVFRLINKTLFQIIYSRRKQVWFCHYSSSYWWPDWIYLATMMTSSYGNIFRVIGSLWGEFTGHRWFLLNKPVTRSFDVFFEMCLNKRWNKPSRCWWFETPSRLLWRQCNDFGGQFGSRVWTKRHVLFITYWFT